MGKETKWSIPVTEKLDAEVKAHIQNSSYKTKSEFVRTATRDRMREEDLLRKILQILDDMKKRLDRMLTARVKDE